MKIVNRTCHYSVTATPEFRRAVRLELASLTIAMQPHEARQLADALVDAAEESEGMQE